MSEPEASPKLGISKHTFVVGGERGEGNAFKVLGKNLHKANYQIAEIKDPKEKYTWEYEVGAKRGNDSIDITTATITKTKESGTQTSPEKGIVFGDLSITITCDDPALPSEITLVFIKCIEYEE